jgi:DNA-binding transcriptional MerR regulator
VVEESTQTSIQKQLGATEALLQGYYVALCEKLSSLESGVCATLLEEFSQSNAQLSEKLSALYQRALLLNTAVSSEIANKIGNLTLNASGDEAVICGKIAAFRAQAIDNINKLCEKFSAVKVNTILALSDVEQQILEKLSDLDATIQEMAIRVSVIAGQVRGIQPLLV